MAHSLRPKELEIPAGDPFKNCKLNRKPVADMLTNIVKLYKDGFVMGLNNEWGTGKSTFVKMWRQCLLNNSFRTVYFNAWESDFSEDPLISILAEFRNSSSVDSNSNKFQNLLDKAGTFALNLFPIAAKSTAQAMSGGVIVVDGATKVANMISEALIRKIDEHRLRRNNIGSFRQALTDFVNSETPDLPLVFIVDELDRCRPDYAVRILEIIKHLFSVPGVVFVLSIDKHQLEGAIKGYYGSDLIDASEYLRRFIDIDFSLPKPEIDNFAKYLFSYYNYGVFFQTVDRNASYELVIESMDFVDVCIYLAKAHSLSLRKLERILALARLSLSAVEGSESVFPFHFVFLVFLKISKLDIFNRILNKELSVQNLNDVFEEYFMSNISYYKGSKNMVYIQALFLVWYANYCYRNFSFFENDSDRFMIKSKFYFDTRRESLEECVRDVFRKGRLDEVNLDVILQRINLTSRLMTQ